MSNTNMDPDGLPDTAVFTILPSLALKEVNDILKAVQTSNLDIAVETKIFESLLKWLNVNEEPGRKHYALFLLSYLKINQITLEDWKKNFQENKELLEVDLIRCVYLNTIVGNLTKADHINKQEVDQEVFMVKQRFAIP